MYRNINNPDIVFEGFHRYYKVDLTKREFNLENTTPYKLVIGDLVIEKHSWGELILETVTHFLTVTPKSNDELIKFRVDWSKREIFTEKKKAQHKELPCGLYLNCNNNARHSCWMLALLLEYFGVGTSSVTLLIHRAPSAEPKEVRDEVVTRFKLGFSSYLKAVAGKNDDEAREIIEMLEKLNPHLEKISRGYNNLFLFDNYSYAYNYTKDLKESVSARITLNREGREVLWNNIDTLLGYYKIITKNPVIDC